LQILQENLIENLSTNHEKTRIMEDQGLATEEDNHGISERNQAVC